MDPLRVVRTGFTEAQMMPRTLIFVMQTEQYGDSGSVVWNVSVWRLTVISRTGAKSG